MERPGITIHDCTCRREREFLLLLAYFTLIRRLFIMDFPTEIDAAIMEQFPKNNDVWDAILQRRSDYP